MTRPGPPLAGRRVSSSRWPSRQDHRSARAQAGEPNRVVEGRPPPSSGRMRCHPCRASLAGLAAARLSPHRALWPRPRRRPSQGRRKSEDGKYFDRGRHADLQRQGRRHGRLVHLQRLSAAIHAECHVCHGPDGHGSTYAPSLVESMKRLDYAEFLEVVVNGRKIVGSGQAERHAGARREQERDVLHRRPLRLPARPRRRRARRAAARPSARTSRRASATKPRRPASRAEPCAADAPAALCGPGGVVARLARGAAAAQDAPDLVSRDVLRVCGDPANLPFSNERGEGFENRIAGDRRRRAEGAAALLLVPAGDRASCATRSARSSAT